MSRHVYKNHRSYYRGGTNYSRSGGNDYRNQNNENVERSDNTYGKDNQPRRNDNSNVPDWEDSWADYPNPKTKSPARPSTSAQGAGNRSWEGGNTRSNANNQNNPPYCSAEAHEHAVNKAMEKHTCTPNKRNAKKGNDRPILTDLPTPPTGYARLICPGCFQPVFVPEKAKWVEYPRIMPGDHIFDLKHPPGYVEDESCTPWWQRQCENCARWNHTACLCDQVILARKCTFCKAIGHEIIDCRKRSKYNREKGIQTITRNDEFAHNGAFDIDKFCGCIQPYCVPMDLVEYNSHQPSAVQAHHTPSQPIDRQVQANESAESNRSDDRHHNSQNMPRGQQKLPKRSKANTVSYNEPPSRPNKVDEEEDWDRQEDAEPATDNTPKITADKRPREDSALDLSTTGNKVSPNKVIVTGEHSPKFVYTYSHMENTPEPKIGNDAISGKSDQSRLEPSTSRGRKLTPPKRPQFNDRGFAAVNTPKTEQINEPPTRANIYQDDEDWDPPPISQRTRSRK